MIFIEYFVVGIIGSLVLAVVAKGIMAKVLQRNTDYYDDGGEHNG